MHLRIFFLSRFPKYRKTHVHMMLIIILYFYCLSRIIFKSSNVAIARKGRGKSEGNRYGSRRDRASEITAI